MKRIIRLKYFIITFWIIVFLSSCRKENDNSPITINNVIGYAQKGPFVNGSSITIYDLLSNLSPTGKSYNVQITDNRGTFEISSLPLSSNYVSFKADGFYYNEVAGATSSAQLTLYALSDVSDKSNININLLTNLEKSRIDYLMKNGRSFSESKSQAQKEILAIFNIQKDDIKTSESLNIVESGEDNGILLAISSILQGFRSESELTELLSSISEDIREDGILSDYLGSELINHAVYLDTTSIENNLIQKYRDIGYQANVPDYEKYITNFISNTNFKITGSIIEYPQTGSFGLNILSINDTIYSGTDFSLAANIPKGAVLKIKITALSSGGIWYFSEASGPNWSSDTFTGSQNFTAINSGVYCDMHMIFVSGRYLIQYYETKSSIPTREKIIKI